MAEDSGKNAPAAYLPFKTFLSALEVMEHGIPRKLDRTIWRSQSGIVQGQIMMAFRFFGLVNENDEPTIALQRLVEGKDKRQEMVGSLLRHAYRAIIDHDLTKMTPRMLEEEMNQYGVSGDTRRKAIGFFLRAARFAELPMHPLLIGLVRETSNATRKKRIKGKNGTEAPPLNGEGSTTYSSGSGVNRRTIQLNSGGSVSLEISADPFSLSSSDREFLFGLVDKLQAYSTVSASEEVEKDEE
jgi:hypothetical protein